VKMATCAPLEQNSVFTMDALRVATAGLAYSINALVGCSELLRELRRRNKDVLYAQLDTTACLELKTINCFHAPEDISVRIILKYLKNVREALLMMNSLVDQ
jgi:hypothetical protein